MANIATGEFAAACSNAGALGLIGAGGMRDGDTLRENIRRCKALTDQPFGVNIMPSRWEPGAMMPSTQAGRIGLVLRPLPWTARLFSALRWMPCPRA